jgi:peptidoglycan/xylan/chitin deacetylase (PgdA/CDA1 family)
MLRRGRGLAYELSGLNALARRRLDGTRGFILNYHRVIPLERVVSDAVEDGMYVTPASFKLQLKILQDYFHIMSLSEMVNRIIEGRSLPRGACAITFDDGWKDTHEYAFPELRRAGLPATVFVVTERVGTDGAFWPDDVCRRLAALSERDRSELALSLGAPPDHANSDGLLAYLKDLAESDRRVSLEQLKAATPAPTNSRSELMNWDELAELRDWGFDIESHSASHAILVGLDPASAEIELRTSLSRLRERGFGRNALFAYPSGRHDARLHKLVAEVGYRAALILEDRLASLTSPPMAIPRLGVHEGIGRTRPEFLCKVPGWS